MKSKGALFRWARLLLAALIFAGMLWLIFHGFDYVRFMAALRGANLGWMAMIPATICVEQWFRAWKWRQFLVTLSATVTTWQALRALMAGYVPGLAVGLGSSALTRSWLIARRDPRLTPSAVLATVTVDRLVDSLMFLAFVAVAVMLAPLPDSARRLSLGLAVGGGASLVITAGLLFLLLRRSAWLAAIPRLLPGRWRPRLLEIGAGFVRGAVWPRGAGRQAIVGFAAVVIKLLAIAQFFWAGLAIGVRLPAAAYVFVMVCLGLWVVIGFVVQVPGSSIVASVFVLGLFGVAREQALAMTLFVGASFLASYGGLGALALWREGASWQELRGVFRPGRR